jgi:gliding motility-associated-like protein
MSKKITKVFYWLLGVVMLTQVQTLKAQTLETYIMGTVYNDVNGMTDDWVNGTATNAGGINAILIDTVTNLVVANTAVAANGLFTFLHPDTGRYYRVLISTTAGTVGNAPPAVVLPNTNWVNTGEFFGNNTGSELLKDGKLYLGKMTALNDTFKFVNLAIEQRPTATNFTALPTGNPPNNIYIDIPPAYFGGTDPDAGVIDSLLITLFPSNCNSLKVGAITYSALTFPTGGVYVPTNVIGQPTVPVSIDPISGNITVLISFRVVDNATFLSANTAIINMQLINRMDVEDNKTALQLVQKLTGEGVIVLNPTLNCAGVANGTFSVVGTTNLGIDSGIVLTSGRAKTNGALLGVNGPNVSAGPGQSNGTPGDAQLSAILNGTGTFDACILEFDFVPAGDKIKFDYVFGSTEYWQYSCSQYNDVFGFIISGPGFATPYNMAVVPGTNIPVAVNSTTNPAIQPITVPTPASIATYCNSMGTGSPFAQYFVFNQNGLTVTYGGFTSVFTAEATVNPCDTFHLKLAIADGSDSGLDSGVFLKAGSLNSAALTVKTFGGGGLETPFTNTVRGCPPGTIRVSRSSGLHEPLTIPLLYAGTAVNGLDYIALPPSITLPIGDSVATINISGIPVNPATGPRSAIISIVSPYTCGDGEPVILSSDTIMIYDSIYVNILTNDTAICVGNVVNVDVEADDFLQFRWTPGNLVSDSTIRNPLLMPTDSTTFNLSVSIPGVLQTACAASNKKIAVDVKVTPQINLGPDVVTCGAATQLNAATTPLNDDETFSWTPATGLNDATIRNPMATVTNTTVFTVTVNPGAIGCDGVDSILVRLLPDHINLLNNDTAVCYGTQIDLVVDGDTNFVYTWAPELDIQNPTVANTVLTARTSGYYTVTASYPNCIAMPDSVYVEVQPIPTVNIGDDKIICDYDSVNLFAAVLPYYNNYTYEWNHANNLNNPAIPNPIFTGDSTVNMVVKVTTPIGCTGIDTMSIIVYPSNFMYVASNDTGFCPTQSVMLQAYGADQYLWTPATGLSANNIANPIAQPLATTTYMLYGNKDYGNHVCYDTQTVLVNVYPSAVLTLPDTVEIWPGESYQMSPETNCSYFSWYPPSGLSSTEISNPLASPEVRTRYFITATTENKCSLNDSIDVVVNTESILDVPNAFVPSNGDFKIEKRGIAQLKYFRIYNRWGNVMFETTDINKGWNGRHNDQEQPLGVYVYTIEAQTSTGKVFTKTGNVTLVR